MPTRATNDPRDVPTPTQGQQDPDVVPHAITQTVPMECVNATGTLTTVDTVLGYDPADPYAVTVTFHTAAATWSGSSPASSSPEA